MENQEDPVDQQKGRNVAPVSLGMETQLRPPSPICRGFLGSGRTVSITSSVTAGPGLEVVVIVWIFSP